MTEQDRPRRAITYSERVKIGSPAHRIVCEKFGGLTAFERATGFKTATVHNWLRSGLVPSKWYAPGISYQRYIMQRAKKFGIDVTAEDFIERG